MVAEQLTSLGTLETVQLMGLGFPVRIKYDVVRRRYLPRLAAVEGSALLSPKLFAEMIMEVRVQDSAVPQQQHAATATAATAQQQPNTLSPSLPPPPHYTGMRLPTRGL